MNELLQGNDSRVNGYEAIFDHLPMSAFGGKAEVFQGVGKSPLIARSGHYLSGAISPREPI